MIDYEGKPKLFEIAQCPPSKLDEFKSIKKFKIFNTNNLWVNLRAIKKLVEENKTKDVDVIVNYKVMKDDTTLISLESPREGCHSIGNSFRCCYRVLRKCQRSECLQESLFACQINIRSHVHLISFTRLDLFVVQSNLYNLYKGKLIMNPKRPYPSVPLVNLGQEFKTVADFMNRIKSIPDILELDQLTISGDVYIGSGVTLRGTVIIVANHGSRIDIPDGATLENKVVSGNLRILDH